MEQTANGSTLHVSAGTPATLDKTGYSALTFTEVGLIEKIGTFGAATNTVKFTPQKGPITKHKGSTDYGSLQPSMAHDPADAGQTIIRTFADPANNALLTCKVTYPDGAKRYFRARVFGYTETADGPDSILMANPTIEICTPIVKDDPA